ELLVVRPQRGREERGAGEARHQPRHRRSSVGRLRPLGRRPDLCLRWRRRPAEGVSAVVTLDLLFGQVVEMPDPYAQERFAALVGIDNIKDRLVMEATVLLDPGIIERWSASQHKP